jgi:general secretion pathway protein E
MFEGSVWVGAGCARCNRSGYYGRIGFFELITINAALRKAIGENRPVSELAALVDDSFMSMRGDGIRKAVAGNTTIEEVLRATQDTDDIAG